MSELGQFLREQLRSVDAQPFASDDSPPWWEDGVTVEIDESTYFEHLDLLPPRYMNGDVFVVDEGAGNFVIFWSEAPRYFARQLSNDDTETFCRLECIALRQ